MGRLRECLITITKPEFCARAVAKQRRRAREGYSVVSCNRLA